MDTDSTGQAEPIFITVADAALLLGINRSDLAHLLEPTTGPAIAWVEQFGRVSVVLASLREYADGLIEQRQTA